MWSRQTDSPGYLCSTASHDAFGPSSFWLPKGAPWTRIGSFCAPGGPVVASSASVLDVIGGSAIALSCAGRRAVGRPVAVQDAATSRVGKDVSTTPTVSAAIAIE